MVRTLNLTPSDNSLLGGHVPGDIVLVKCDATDLAFTVTLPDASNARNVNLIFKKIDSGANAITISGKDAQTIDGASTKLLRLQNETYSLLSDGTNWNIISFSTDNSDKISLKYDPSTGERGILMRMINNTGAATVKGSVVRADTTDDNSFILAPADSDEAFAVVYEAGIADGSEALVWIAGKVQVLLQDSTAATRGYWVRTSTSAAGRADATNANPPGSGVPELDRHMCEIGHCLESKTAGTNVLALTNLHFN